MTHREKVARGFAEAFNEQRLEDLENLLHPKIEVQSMRGVRRGLDEALRWATKNPHGELDQRIVVERCLERSNHVLMLIRRQWRWKKSGEVGSDDEAAVLVTFRDGLISSWRPFHDRGDGYEAAGINPGSV